MLLDQIKELYSAGGDWERQLNVIHSELSTWVRWYCDSWMKDERLKDVLRNAQSGSRSENGNEGYAVQLYNSLLKMCDEKLNEEPDLKKREDVRRNIFQNIQERYKENPLKLIEAAVNCLNQEELLWQSFQQHQICESLVHDDGNSDSIIKLETALDTEMDTDVNTIHDFHNTLPRTPDRENLNLKIVHLKSRVETVEGALEKVKAKEQNYKTDMPFILSQVSILSERVCSQIREEKLDQIQQIENAHTRLTKELKESRESFLKALQETQHKIDEVFMLLMKEISDWKEHQKMFYLKLEDEPVKGLQKLSQWCADVGDRLFFLLQKLDQCRKSMFYTENLGNEGKLIEQRQELSDCRDHVKMKLEELIKRSTIQTVQPPYIIQVTSSKSSPGTSRSFTAKLRVLALEKVSVSISEEIQVQLLSEAELNQEPCTKKISLELHNGAAYLEKKKSGIYDLVEASFDSLQVRKFKRPKRARKAAANGPDQLFVCEQKFRLVFTGKFSIPGSMDVISLRSVSLPVTITTNSSQESDCSAAQLWQCWNSPADNDTGPYPWPDTAPWPKVSEMLNMKMKIDTGRALPADQLTYLADQLNGGPPNDQNYENLTISWSQFAKEKMEDKDFTFWRWFHASVNILKFHTKEEWVDGRIYGFVSKSKAKDLLRAHKPGTFLLRISESKISESGPNITGALSPVVVSTRKKNGKTAKGVDQIAPYTVKELELRGNLGKVLESTEADTKVLYPDMIPREEAFKKYKCLKEPKQDGRNDGYNTYVGRTIHFKLDMLSITDEVDDDCDDEDENVADDDDSLNGPWSCYTDASVMTPLSDVVNPLSVDPMQTPYSPDAISPPGSLPHQQQPQQHNNHQQQQQLHLSNQILKGLLSTKPLQEAPSVMDYSQLNNSLNGNGSGEYEPSGSAYSPILHADLPVAAYPLDQNADEFPQTSTIRDLDENSIYQIPNPLENDTPFTPPIMTDSENLDWTQIVPSFDPSLNLATT